MIHFEGVELFRLPLAEVYAQLADAGALAGLLPDTDVKLATPDRAEWKVTPKLSFLSGTLDTTAVITARVPTSEVRYTLETKAIGSGSTVEAVLNFEATADGGTSVKWVGDITKLSGLLKLAPKGLIQATAGKVIADVWAAIKVKMGN
jgi:uncharacterized protein